MRCRKSSTIHLIYYYTHAREGNQIVFATQKQPAKITRDLRRIHEQLLPNSRVFFIVFAHKSDKDCAQTRSKSRTNPEQFARDFGGKIFPYIIPFTNIGNYTSLYNTKEHHPKHK